MTHTIEDYNKEKKAILDDIDNIVKCVNDLQNIISEPKFVNKTVKKIVPIKNNNGVHLYRDNQIIDITDDTEFRDTDELVIVYSNHSFIVCKEDVEQVPFFASKEDKKTAIQEFDKRCSNSGEIHRWLDYNYERDVNTFSFFSWDAEQSTKKLISKNRFPGIQLPENSYIPTVNQLYLIGLYQYEIDDIMPKINGNPLTKATYNVSSYYLSSTESNEKGVFYYMTGAQTIYTLPALHPIVKDGLEYYYVRPIKPL